MYSFLCHTYMCLALTLYGCKSNVSTNNKLPSTNQNQPLVHVIKPINGEKYVYGSPISFQIKLVSDTIQPDSIEIKINDKKIGTIKGSNELNWTIENQRLGNTVVKFKVYRQNYIQEQVIRILIVSNIEPRKINYTVLKTYPHSTDAYTQGLIYENGYFYESDGQYGKSALRKVEISSGKTLQVVPLADKYFAEGIALLQNKIYQITWRENTCLVYDKNTFQLEKQIKYDIAEGWGLTTDGTNLIMTDGSSWVYIVEPESFSIIEKFEVVDNEKTIDNLNELEYVNGKLFANIYMTDYVVVIDMQSRRVEGIIDFSNLLQSTDRKPNTDVLNGIAYNPHTQHFYFTGKNWPKLFEVKLHGY